MADRKIIHRWMLAAEPWPLEYHEWRPLADFMIDGYHLEKASGQVVNALLLLFTASEPWPQDAPDREAIEAALVTRAKQVGLSPLPEAETTL